MFYLNSIFLGNEASTTYNSSTPTSERHMKRLMYIFLKYVAGWSLVDSSGTWDNPFLPGSTDGATDGTDPNLFSAASGTFGSLVFDGTTRYVLLLTGFTGGDVSKNGIYNIARAESPTSLRIVRTITGVHHAGFPLGKSGLTWKIYDVKSTSVLPVTGSFWVLSGTENSRPFHVHCNALTANKYTPQYTASPYDDWNAVTHAWKTPARYTATAMPSVSEHMTDFGVAWGVADLTYGFFVLVHYYWNTSTNIYDRTVVSYIYIGNITPFRPAVDLYPTVCVVSQHDGYVGTADPSFVGPAKGRIYMLSASNAQDTGKIIYPSNYGADGTLVTSGTLKQVSSLSGRLFRLPLLVGNWEDTKAEIRGYFKGLNMTHVSSPRIFHPFGSTNDRLRFVDICTEWNGSGQYIYVPLTSRTF